MVRNPHQSLYPVFRNEVFPAKLLTRTELQTIFLQRPKSNSRETDESIEKELELLHPEFDRKTNRRPYFWYTLPRKKKNRRSIVAIVNHSITQEEQKHALSAILASYIHRVHFPQTNCLSIVSTGFWEKYTFDSEGIASCQRIFPTVSDNQKTQSITIPYKIFRSACIFQERKKLSVRTLASKIGIHHLCLMIFLLIFWGQSYIKVYKSKKAISALQFEWMRMNPFSIPIETINTSLLENKEVTTNQRYCNRPLFSLIANVIDSIVEKNSIKNIYYTSEGMNIQLHSSSPLELASAIRQLPFFEKVSLFSIRGTSPYETEIHATLATNAIFLLGDTE